MSKGDGDRDETPIQFYIPRISARGRAPIPVNQPNWKYSSDADSPPSLGAWIFTAISDIIGVGMIYLAFTEISNPRKWALIGLFGFLMIFITLPLVLQHWRFHNRKKIQQENEPREKPEKKLPKRRKDYR